MGHLLARWLAVSTIPCNGSIVKRINGTNITASFCNHPTMPVATGRFGPKEGKYWRFFKTPVLKNDEYLWN